MKVNPSPKRRRGPWPAPLCAMRMVEVVVVLSVFVLAPVAVGQDTGGTSAQPGNDAKVQKSGGGDLAAQAEARFDEQNWAEAAKLYKQVVEAHPDDGRAWLRLGYALHAAGKYEEAIKAHQKAAEFPRAKVTALYNLGCAYALTGKKEKAFAALDEAVAAGFSNADNARRDADLESLHGDARWGPLLAHMADARSPEYRQFDFWVGEWDVYNPAGVKVGTSRITRQENGYMIHEAWTNMRGGGGQSINYLDPSDHKWKQVWVDDSGGVVYYEGTFRDGAMHFTGRSIGANGSEEIARASFTPRDDGTVRQFIEQSSDKGETWHVYFDGLYAPKGSAPPKRGVIGPPSNKPS